MKPIKDTLTLNENINKESYNKFVKVLKDNAKISKFDSFKHIINSFFDMCEKEMTKEELSYVADEFYKHCVDLGAYERSSRMWR